jgi:excisionase family DNA binding protein
MEEKFYSVKEYADLMKIHENTVYNHIKTGQLQAFRIGSGKKASYRISSNEILRIREFDTLKVIDELVEKKLFNILKQENFQEWVSAYLEKHDDE